MQATAEDAALLPSAWAAAAAVPVPHTATHSSSSQPAKGPHPQVAAAAAAAAAWLPTAGLLPPIMCCWPGLPVDVLQLLQAADGHAMLPVVLPCVVELLGFVHLDVRVLRTGETCLCTFACLLLLLLLLCLCVMECGASCPNACPCWIAILVTSAVKRTNEWRHRHKRTHSDMTHTYLYTHTHHIHTHSYAFFSELEKSSAKHVCRCSC
jgi:hypothetical protein